MFALLALHLVIGVALIAIGDRLDRRAFLVAAIAPAAMLGWALTRWGDLIDGEPVTQSVTWVSSLDLAIDLRLDAFGLLMVLLVSGIGVLIGVYGYGYFSSSPVATARLAGLVCLFAGAMTGVVISDHLLSLFVFWELTSITSYLLIGNSDRKPQARAAALQALLITGAGGLVMLFGLVLLGELAGTYRISELAGAALRTETSGGVLTAALVCILVGAFTKSAQAPFSSWLPGAMVAPTPISAYLHSATMVKAGVYLIARLAPIMALAVPWRTLVLVVGLTTMLIGGLRAIKQTDLKLLLAFGTVSQLGLLVALFGVGVPAVTHAAIVLILAHALFKAALFMVVGIVDHEVGCRDVRRLTGFGPGWRPVLGVAIISAASMAGLPFVLGFIGKEEVLDALVEAEVGGARWVLGVVVLGSVLTVAYSTRFVLGLFGRYATDDPRALADLPAGQIPAVPSPQVHAPPAGFAGPSVLLALASLVTGLVPASVDALVTAATVALHPDDKPKHLALWHGVNAALVLSIVVVTAGFVVAALLPRLTPRMTLGPRVPSAERGYLAALTGATAFAKRTTAVVQNGSLPAYLGVILLTVAVVPSVALLASGDVGALPDLVDMPFEVPVTGLLIVAAMAAAMLRRRFGAALVLGAVGYAMTALYVMQGAPDLALTQLAVETLTVVLFMLVLRHLPDEFGDRVPLMVSIGRIVVSVAVAVFVFLFAITSVGERTETPVSQEMIERSATEAKGNNVVNVIIVDFRGIDTLGEIAVLVVAAVGAIGLVRPDRLARRRTGSTAPTTDAEVAEEVPA